MSPSGKTQVPGSLQTTTKNPFQTPKGTTEGQINVNGMWVYI